MIFQSTPIAVHGDAAVAGQGILYEIVQMAQLDGYKQVVQFICN
jgi:2-oxoglutarate dehydrogenase complex dehydrogenase (E1) component-like enzyme